MPQFIFFISFLVLLTVEMVVLAAVMVVVADVALVVVDAKAVALAVVLLEGAVQEDV